MSRPEGGAKVACILITKISNRLLIAVPGSARHRTLSSRILPARALSKAVSFAIASSDPFDRVSVVPGTSTRDWVDFLSPEFDTDLQLATDPSEEYHFVNKDGTNVMFPHVRGLVEIADDKFCFMTATSADGAPLPQATAMRTICCWKLPIFLSLRV